MLRKRRRIRRRKRKRKKDNKNNKRILQNVNTIEVKINNKIV